MQLLINLDPKTVALLERIAEGPKNNELCSKTYDMWEQAAEAAPTTAGDPEAEKKEAAAKAKAEKAAKDKAEKAAKAKAKAEKAAKAKVDKEAKAAEAAAAAKDLEDDLDDGLKDDDNLMGDEDVKTLDDVKAAAQAEAKAFSREKVQDVLSEFDAVKTADLDEKQYTDATAALLAVLDEDEV